MAKSGISLRLTATSASPPAAGPYPNDEHHDDDDDDGDDDDDDDDDDDGDGACDDLLPQHQLSKQAKSQQRPQTHLCLSLTDPIQKDSKRKKRNVSFFQGKTLAMERILMIMMMIVVFLMMLMMMISFRRRP